MADSSTYVSFGGTIVITKTLAAASANNIALSQTPVSGTPLLLNGAAAAGGVATVDTQRRVLLTYGNEGAARTLLLTGANSQGAVISETLAVPSGGSGTIASLRDYLTVTRAIPLGGGWSAAVTLGTNGVGSTAPQLPSGYPAVFDIGFQISISGTANCTIEFTRDIPYAVPQIYTPGMGIMPPQCDWDGWPTLGGTAGLTAETFADIDSRVTAWRLTINSGTGICTARATAVGLRT